MDYEKLEKALTGEPVFRLSQARRAVFRDLIEDWNLATILSLAARKKLATECPLDIQAEVFISIARQSAKALITLADGLKIETVLMRHQGPPSSRFAGLRRGAGRNTICVSAQVGCPLGCVFCATGQMGFKRNLMTGEILEQVLFWGRWLKNKSPLTPPLQRGEQKEGIYKKKELQKINNVVFMGMGEPFLNYDNVMAAIKIINDKDSFNIGSRHISVSTVGIVEGIKKFIEEPLQVNLAISLHAPNDKLRSEIMPINKKYPLKNVLKETAVYIKKTNRKVMFEYVMIKGINDSDDCARELIALLKNFPKHLSMVNLILYNETGFFSPSPSERVKKFQQILIDGGVQALQRYHFGGDIKGACGQLAAK